jgi:hypothetical protein
MGETIFFAGKLLYGLSSGQFRGQKSIVPSKCPEKWPQSNFPKNKKSPKFSKSVVHW